jgi:hypothetical protein
VTANTPHGKIRLCLQESFNCYQLSDVPVPYDKPLTPAPVGQTLESECVIRELSK